MRNKYSHLSIEDLEKRLKEATDLRELMSFNSATLGRELESDICFIQAALIIKKRESVPDRV
jgi:hypothetical protein